MYIIPFFFFKLLTSPFKRIPTLACYICNEILIFWHHHIARHCGSITTPTPPLY